MVGEPMLTYELCVQECEVLGEGSMSMAGVWICGWLFWQSGLESGSFVPVGESEESRGIPACYMNIRHVPLFFHPWDEWERSAWMVRDHHHLELWCWVAYCPLTLETFAPGLHVLSYVVLLSICLSLLDIFVVHLYGSQLSQIKA